MSVEFIEHIIDTDWVEGADGDTPGVTGRNHPVPKPTIEVETERSQIRLQNQDHVHITDGGNENQEPMGVGFTHKAVDSFVAIEVRTTVSPPDPPDVERPGRVRFEGARDANNDSETYGGLKGEVERILDLYRKGHKEFEVILASTWRDETGLTGKNHYRGVWVVGLEERAREIVTQALDGGGP